MHHARFVPRWCFHPVLYTFTIGNVYLQYYLCFHTHWFSGFSTKCSMGPEFGTVALKIPSINWPDESEPLRGGGGGKVCARYNYLLTFQKAALSHREAVEWVCITSCKLRVHMVLFYPWPSPQYPLHRGQWMYVPCFHSQGYDYAMCSKYQCTFVMQLWRVPWLGTFCTELFCAEKQLLVCFINFSHADTR